MAVFHRTDGWESPLAIDCVCCGRLAVNTTFAQEPGAGEVWALAGSVGEVPHSLLVVGRAGEFTAKAAACRGRDARQLRNGHGGPAVYRDADGLCSGGDAAF